MDASLCWVVAGLAAAISCGLSLILGALRSYSLARFEQRLEDDPERMEQLQELLDDEEKLILSFAALRGIFAAGGMATLTGGLIADALAAAATSPIPPWTWVLVSAKATAVGTALFVAAGGTIPAAIGEGRAEGIILRLQSFIRFLGALTSPLGWFFGGLSRVFLRVFDVKEVSDKEEAKDDILSAALAGQDEGVIDGAVVDVIEKLVQFHDVAVTEVMTPRIDICTVDATATADEMLEMALESEMSRMPVIEGSVDKIVGILIVKDLLRALKDPRIEPKSLFRKPIFVPETKRVPDLLKELRAMKIHMAIVADEYGGTAGVVTIEDLIEEIIGDIEDEHDNADVPALRRLSDTLIDVDAKYHIDQFNEEFSTKIPEDEDVETLGGFMALRLGKIPQTGDRVDVNGTSFVVTEADERRASRVQIQLK